MVFSQSFYLFFAIFMMTLSVVSSAQVRADSLLNDIMPSVFGERDRGSKPEETLIAPFAQDDQGSRMVKPDEAADLKHPENLMSVTLPNHESLYMTTWADDIVARVMSYNLEGITQNRTQDLTAREKLLKEFFLPSGILNVNAVFQDPYFQERLVQKSMRIQAFVETPATIQNEGVFGGVYRWLIDVPVTITFFPQGDVQYKGAQAKASLYETKKITIRLQIGRVASGYPDGIAIESFTFVGAMP